MPIYLDTETYSSVDLKKTGVYACAERGRVICIAIAIDNDPVEVFDTFNNRVLDVLPKKYIDALFHSDEIIYAVNAQFDRVFLKHGADKCDIPVHRWRCVSVMGWMAGLPGSLETLGALCKLSEDQAKSKAGRALMKLFSFTESEGTPDTHPVEWRDYMEYCRQDVASMRRVIAKLPRFNDKFWDQYHVDQTINDRGFFIDRSLVVKAMELVRRTSNEFDETVQDNTFGKVESVSKRDQILRILNDVMLDKPIPDLQSSTIDSYLTNHPNISAVARDILQARASGGAASVKKWTVLDNSLCRDGAIRGSLVYYGANRTGRWSGKGFQPQNLPRPNKKHGVIEADIEKLLNGVPSETFNNGVSCVEFAQNALRSAIIARQGKKLVVADLANIEGRVLSWIADESWKLKAFYDYDAGEGPDLYKMAYAKAFRKSPADVDDNERQVGKVMELACFSADTQILTDSGYKAIVEVSIFDRLWDGIEWVSHEGVIAKGVRQTINLDGVEVTPDHLIRTGTTWRQAKELGLCESSLRQALETGSENLPSLGLTTVPQGGYFLPWLNAHVVPTLTECCYLICVKDAVRDVISALKSKQGIGERIFSDMQKLLLTMPTAGGYATEYPHVLLDAPARGTKGGATTEEEAYGYTKNGLKTGGFFYPTWLRYLVGMILAWSLIEWITTRDTNRETLDSLPKKKTFTTEEQFKNSNSELQSLKNVYDIVNAGPRNRFTIKTNRGHLIVHNCGYMGGVGAFSTFAVTYGVNLDAMAAGLRGTIPADISEECARGWDWAKKQHRTQDLPEHIYKACDALKRMWRRAHPKTVELWDNIKMAVITADNNPGDVIWLDKIAFQVRNKFLIIALPSGRTLAYPGFQVTFDAFKTDDDYDAHIYNMMFRYHEFKGSAHHFQRTYAGKLTENIVQAIARDVLAQGLLNAEKAGMPVVLHVHDEIVCETPDHPEYSLGKLQDCMVLNIPWANELPLAAAGYEAYRYRK